MEKMSHVGNDSLMALSEPDLNSCALSHSSIVRDSHMDIWADR